MQPAPAIVFLLQSTRSAIPSRPQAPTTWSWLSLDCCLKTISTNPIQEKLSCPSRRVESLISERISGAAALQYLKDRASCFLRDSCSGVTIRPGNHLSDVFPPLLPR